MEIQLQGNNLVFIIMIFLNKKLKLVLILNIFYYFHSCGNMDPVSSVGRRNRLPTETGSCSSNADITGENLLLNSNSPVKSPPYSSAESDDNSFKGTGKCNILF